MLPIIWSIQADNDLLSIVEHILEHNEAAAHRMANAIRTSTLLLSEHPYLYRRSERVFGCREIVAHRNYVVVYRVEADCIRIIRVLHTSRMRF